MGGVISLVSVYEEEEDDDQRERERERKNERERDLPCLPVRARVVIPRLMSCVAAATHSEVFPL